MPDQSRFRYVVVVCADGHHVWGRSTSGPLPVPVDNRWTHLRAGWVRIDIEDLTLEEYFAIVGDRVPRQCPFMECTNRIAEGGVVEMELPPSHQE